MKPQQAGNIDNTHVEAIATALGLPEPQVRAALQLLDDGNTLPFIARYRKEATGGLDEIALRAIEDAWELELALKARKATILKTIASQGLLTLELEHSIHSCREMSLLESLYLPFKPKRRTRATLARQRGLQPLADLLTAQAPLERTRQQILNSFVNPANDVPDAQAALQGGLDIVAEQWSEQAELRNGLVSLAWKEGRIGSQVKPSKKSEADKFDAYRDHQEPVAKIPSHRLLAILRGVAEEVLKVGLIVDDAHLIGELKRKLVRNREFEFYAELLQTVEDCYQRLLKPATESSVLQQLKERADEEAIAVFGKNLREVLMAAPAGPRVTIGIDPGFRTGCKIAVVDRDRQGTRPRHDLPHATTTGVRISRQTIIGIDTRTCRRVDRHWQWNRIARNRCLRGPADWRTWAECDQGYR